jgi:hypothetical protein
MYVYSFLILNTQQEVCAGLCSVSPNHVTEAAQCVLISFFLSHWYVITMEFLNKKDSCVRGLYVHTHRDCDKDSVVFSGPCVAECY